jgi:hypothetical protein
MKQQDKTCVPVVEATEEQRETLHEKAIGKHIETNENYWDCNCEEDYIHERAKKKYCVKCNSLHFNQPDARQNEVDILLDMNDS